MNWNVYNGLARKNKVLLDYFVLKGWDHEVKYIGVGEGLVRASRRDMIRGVQYGV